MSVKHRVYRMYPTPQPSFAAMLQQPCICSNVCLESGDACMSILQVGSQSRSPTTPHVLLESLILPCSGGNTAATSVTPVGSRDEQVACKVA